MKRVLVTFVPDYYPSNTGFAQAFFHMHNCILDNKVCEHVYVYAEGNYQSPSDNNITVQSLPGFRGKGLLRYGILRSIEQSYISSKYRDVFSSIRTISEENTIQMILLESMFMAWLAPILKKKFPSIPIVCRIHGTGPEYTAFYKKLDGTKFREYLLSCVFSLKYIAATTKFYFDFFRDYYRDYEKFMDKEFFLLPNTTLSLESLQKDNDTIHILQLGRLDMRGYHQKGFSDTVKALLYIEKINPQLASKIVYTTIGAGNREEEFLSRVKSFSLVKHFHFTKLNNEKVKEIELQSDLVLVPSRCEGMSMFATEAIAAGIPLVCTKGNGLESVGFEGFNAYYVSEYDYIRMAESIIKIISDTSEQKRMSQNSREFFEENCSYKAVSNKYSVIDKFLSGYTC